ncbi:hypothetical protein BKA70DRAFT_1294512 [Coprinopsis sp. MPI-PUGE-AT-0042]|nr:hypothetical protein BKA70DRAFT_1294512 [Coprinopsis sp. MPI-PUGE-AT-0042]
MASTSDLLVLSASDVSQITASFSPSGLQCLMAQVFLSLTRQRLSIEDASTARTSSDPRTQTPHRTTLSMRNHKALWMPARFCPSASGDATTSMKIVCVPKGGQGDGLPATTVVLNEDTGSVRAIVNARKLTALRNAAGSLLSISLVASRCPRHVVVFGAGSQIEAHLDLFLRFFNQVEECVIVNRTLNERAQDLTKSLKARHAGVEFQLYASTDRAHHSAIEEAVGRADLIVCATSATEPLFPSRSVRDGTHLVLIGSYMPQMREVDVELVCRAARSPSVGSSKSMLLVDSKESCMIEAGELLEAKITQEEMVEIGDLVPSIENGTVDELRLGEFFQRVQELPKDWESPGHTGPVTIFKSVGVGLQDVVIAKAVIEQAERSGLGQKIIDYD